MVYGVEITDEFSVELDFPPGAPTPRRMSLDFEADTEAALRDLIPRLGFDAAKLDPTTTLHVRRWLPVTRDGETVARCDVNLWIGDGLSGEPRPAIPTLARICDEARAAVGVDG